MVTEEDVQMVGSKVKSKAPCMILFCAFEHLQKDKVLRRYEQ